MEIFTITSIQELRAFAAAFLADLKPHSDKATVIALSGDLGSGKTTLVQHIAAALGVDDLVTSPTFVVMKKYETTNEPFKALVHMDAYRIESETELEPLRFSELLNEPNTLICIEWPEKIPNAIPDTAIKLNIQIAEGETRTIQIER